MAFSLDLNIKLTYHYAKDTFYLAFCKMAGMELKLVRKKRWKTKNRLVAG
jgi:hypothetical protein